jgi:high-affinity iron transporter
LGAPFLRIILISRNTFLGLTFVVGLATSLAGQADDSLSAARRIVAAASLAAEEYAMGAAPDGARVVAPEEVAEAKLFLDQARFDTPFLPQAVRAYGDSALTELRAMLERVAPPRDVERLVATLTARISAAVGGALIPKPARPPSLARGATVYREQCAFCHGDTGRGDGPKAKSLSGPPPASFAPPPETGSLSLVDAYRRITIGVAGTAMPEFEQALPETDRWAVAAYVLTLQYGGSTDAAVFAVVRRQLDSAVALRSDKLAFAAYLTFEEVETTIRAKHPGLASRLEHEFAQLRQRAAGGATPSELQAIHRALLGDLEHAERVATDKSSGAHLWVQSFLLLVREGFEAILIIAALMTFLTKAGASARRREVALGAWAAVGASAVTAVVFEVLIDAGPGQREVFEGITMLVAVVVLFYVSYWLLSKIAADKWSEFLKSKVQAALSSGSALALVSVAFLAVYREGVETILFYKALLASGGQGGAGAVAAGAGLGAVMLVLLYVAIMRLGLRLPMKAFFAVTGALLYYMAFVFAGKGIAELQEAGVVGTTVIAALQWLRVPFLGIYPTIQSLALQGALLVLLLVALVTKLQPSAISHQPSA